ncbi:MAG: ribosome maturation factor RimM [Ghiorsea sp.]|nr:ribosome maturation factor RimM [Ghiorsea sp.]
MLYIGDILNPHGLKGSLIVFSHTRPADAVAGYLRWYIGKDAENTQVYDVVDCHKHKKRILAKLEGIETIEQVEAIKGMKIFVPEDEVEVDEDEFLWQDLMGCIVLDQKGTKLGAVTALYEFGAQDNLEIKTTVDMDKSGEWLLPFIEDVIVDVDLEEKIIEVHLLEGMDACFTPKS